MEYIQIEKIVAPLHVFIILHNSQAWKWKQLLTQLIFHHTRNVQPLFSLMLTKSVILSIN